MPFTFAGRSDKLKNPQKVCENSCVSRCKRVTYEMRELSTKEEKTDDKKTIGFGSH